MPHSVPLKRHFPVLGMCTGYHFFREETVLYPMPNWLPQDMEHTDLMASGNLLPAEQLHSHQSRAVVVHSGAFQPGQQDPVDQGLSQKVMVLGLGHSDSVTHYQVTVCVLHPTFNTTRKHSRDKCLNIFQPILFCFTGIILPCTLQDI